MHRIGLLLLCGLLYACGPAAELPAAALGDKQSLEKLATAYRAESGKLPVSPTSLTAKGRKKFVEQVFQEAGFDYRKTLFSLSKLPAADYSTLHKDMAQLLSLPHHDLDTKTKEEIYSETELRAVNMMESKLK